MFRVEGQITGRLTRALTPTDPSWTPTREATTPTVTRRAGDGWPVTGRNPR